MPGKVRVLFLCTGNSCRSQMAEAMLRYVGSERFEACSAGSHPAGFIHPLAEECLRRMNLPIEGQSSKSWDEFARSPIDVVITLCDSAAAETCPVWPGTPLKAHWSLADPAYHLGSDAERVDFAMRIADRLRTKIQGLVELDWSLSRAELKRRLEFLGEI